jgi:IS6 family transposase
MNEAEQTGPLPWTPLRTRNHPHLCPLVLAVFAEPAGCRRVDGRALPHRRSHHGVALGCQKYSPMVWQRLKGKVKFKTATWHMDETYVRVSGRWMYLFRAVDDHGDTVDFYLSETRDREAAKAFLQKALSNPDNRPPRVLYVDGNRSYPAAIRDLQAEGRLSLRCRRRTARYANNRVESDHRQVKRRLRAMQGPRTLRTARRLIQGIEAVQMLRKGQILGARRKNFATVSIAFALLFGI